MWLVVKTMNIKLAPMILLACALTLGLMSLYFVGYTKRFERSAVKTRARVVTFSPIASNGQMAPVVEFTAVEDGKPMRKRAQVLGTRQVEGGDEVEILYQRKKVFGLESWNIFIIKDAGSRPYGMYAIVGYVLLVIALILAAAAVAVLMI